MTIKEVKEFIEVTRYIASDGKKFDDKLTAQKYQNVIDGSLRKCSACNGSGQVPNEDYRQFYKCDSCKGNGYLTKKFKEVWE